MNENTNSTTTENPTQERKPDFYARLLADTPAEKAAAILAALCRRKDKAIRRLFTDHETGIPFDAAAQTLAEVYKSRTA